MRDAWNRLWRTCLQGAVVTGLYAGFEVVTSAVQGGTFDAASVARTALVTAGMAAAAYLHRQVVDPSPVPSARPPQDPPLAAERAARRRGGG